VVLDGHRLCNALIVESSLFGETSALGRQSGDMIFAFQIQTASMPGGFR
jgi:hypothetical protein